MTRVPAAARWGAVALVGAAILYASVVPPPAAPRATGPLGLVGLDKWLHALAFAGFAAAVAFALATRALSARAVAALAVGAAVAYGLAIELIQLGVPARHFDPVDLAADAVGAVAVALGWRALARLSGRPRPG